MSSPTKGHTVAQRSPRPRKRVRSDTRPRERGLYCCSQLNGSEKGNRQPGSRLLFKEPPAKSMKNPSENVFGNFLMLYAELRKKTNNDPRKIPLFVSQSSALHELVKKLARVTEYLEKTLANTNRKYLTQVPESFSRAFQDYNERYLDPVMRISSKSFLLELFLSLGETREEAERLVAYYLDLGVEIPFRKPLRAPDFDQQEDEFDPTVHDVALAFEEIRSLANTWLETYADAEQLGDWLMGDRLRVGLGAWEYLEKTIGVDVYGISRRWEMAPMVFVPKHVSDKHGLTEKGSLFDLLSDAVRAFVFGAPTASIAMCRAIWELVLKKHYGLDIETDSPSLAKDIVPLAEVRYSWVKDLKLKGKIRRANQILHDFGGAQKITENDEKIIVEFLTAAKTLIERAPLIDG